MKLGLPGTLSAVAFALAFYTATGTTHAQQALHTRNVVLVTIDGLRWQELFGGADSALIRDRRFTPDTADAVARLWRPESDARRSALMPFVWSTLVTRGQIYGDRRAESFVDVTNRHRFSYPGYNEILTGFADPRINSNNKVPNPNRTILEAVNDMPAFKGRVAMFGSWDVFHFIINEARSGVPVNAGYDTAAGNITEREAWLNALQSQTPVIWPSVRLDVFTHQFALEYMRRETPRLIHIAYGEADDFAHDGRFDHYLDAIHRTDAFLRELWTFIESQPSYRGSTTMIIAGDHGRGNGDQWIGHGGGYEGSQHIWLMAIGPDTPARGVVATAQPLYQNQVAATIARLLGVEYATGQPIGPAVDAILGSAR